MDAFKFIQKTPLGLDIVDLYCQGKAISFY